MWSCYLAGAKEPYKMELDSAKKQKANAAKVFYTLSRDGVPILDLQLRYKGDFKSMPQFFATITDEFQIQLEKKCISLFNRTLFFKTRDLPGKV